MSISYGQMPTSPDAGEIKGVTATSPDAGEVSSGSYGETSITYSSGARPSSYSASPITTSSPPQQSIQPQSQYAPAQPSTLQSPVAPIFQFAYGGIPDYDLHYAMAKDAQSEYPFDPIEITNIFSADDPKAFSWLRFDQVHKPIQVEWRWYSPDGQLYHDETNKIPNPDQGSGDFWENYTLGSQIEIRGTDAQNMPGNWMVDIYFDGRKVLTEPFWITTKDSEGFIEQVPFTGDCINRPPGTYCAVFTDNYILLVPDKIAGKVWSTADTWKGRTVEAIYFSQGDLYHVTGTRLAKWVPH